MATVFNKSIQPLNGNWEVSFSIVSKDPSDVTLAQEFGDIEINMQNKQLVDPDDSTFSFRIPSTKEAIWSNILLNKLPNIVFTYIFDDASIVPATRYRQAVIFANAIQTALTSLLTALRAMPSTTPVNSTVTI